MSNRIIPHNPSLSTYMSDRRLYTPVKPSEFHAEIQSFTHKRPPIGILKKLLASFLASNDIASSDETIWSFITSSYIKYESTTPIIAQLSTTLLEMRLNGSYLTVVGDDSWIDQLYEYLSNNDGCFNRLKLLSCIDIKSVNEQTFKLFTDLLWRIINERLPSMDVQIIHASIRVVHKIAVSEKNSELQKDKITMLFNNITNLIKQTQDVAIISAIADTLLELQMTDKYPFLKISLSIEHVSKLLNVITNAKPSIYTPSILTLLTEYHVDASSQSLCKDVITCVKQFTNEQDFSIVLNTIKCIIHYLEGIQDNKFKEKTILEIIRSFKKLFGNYVDNRVIFFNILRNFLLIIIKFGDNIKEIEHDIESFLQLDESKDKELYIIDTKLEVLYLLCLHDIKSKEIVASLIPLVKSSNDDISYKTIRTLCNLIVKNGEKFGFILDDFIINANISLEKHYLSISIALRDTSMGNLTKYGTQYINNIKAQVNINELISNPNNDYIKDEDVISYLWILSRVGSLDDLINLESSLFKRIENYTIDKKIYIIDAYMSCIVKTWTTSTQPSKLILKMLQNMSKVSKQSELRASFYTRLIIASNGDRTVLSQVLQTTPSSKNESISGLDDDTVDELCRVLGSLACVYLRPVHTVFRHG